MSIYKIIPANQARGKYVHTTAGVTALCSIFPANKLRPDQIIPERVRKGGKNK
jgi:hypothetical protein